MALFFTATAADAGKRLDHYLQERLAGYSRSRLQSWIKDGRVQVNGAAAKASLLLRGREHIEVSPGDLPPLKATPEDLPIEVLYEDASVVAVNKPAGLVVHAGAGAHAGTLVNRLVHRFATPSADHRRRFLRARSRTTVVGGSRAGKTLIASTQPVLAKLYDELIVSVDGYSVSGRPLSGREEIAREMDGYHKVAAARELFETRMAEEDEVAA